MDNMQNTTEPKKTKIMVCDDHRDVTILMKRILKKSAYQVICAYNSDDCLKSFKENKDDIELVIMDINIPSIAGSDLARMVRKMNPDVHVLLTSGHCLEIVKSQHVIDDDFHFIGKPFGPADLRKKVSEILENSKK